MKLIITKELNVSNFTVAIILRPENKSYEISYGHICTKCAGHGCGRYEDCDTGKTINSLTELKSMLDLSSYLNIKNKLVELLHNVLEDKNEKDI